MESFKYSQKGETKFLVIILILLIIIASALIATKYLKKNNEEKQVLTTNTIGKTEKIEEAIPMPKTMSGKERNIAFMIDNNINAMPQAGLEQADLIYEIIVEGGETRLMAIMKNKKLDKIGPLRSARHYFLDYALENDAIYVHYGQSPQAKSDIQKLSIPDINGMYESSTSFWRDSSRYAPHNAVTSTEKLKKIIEREDFRTTTNKGNVLKYSAEEIELDKLEDLKEEEISKVKNANIVNIPYSPYNKVKYEYDEKNKNYIRYSRNNKQKDWNTKKIVTTKNIIITKCRNRTLNDGSGKGRQTLYNVKTLDGYYITNGKVIPIKCEKTSREGKTKYKTLDGEEIKVNDGKTFIQICPEDCNITFE